VHFPEFSLIGGGFGSLGRGAGVEMNRTLREVPKDEAQSVPKTLPHFLDDLYGDKA
jgi:hypothetical protein